MENKLDRMPDNLDVDLLFRNHYNELKLIVRARRRRARRCDQNMTTDLLHEVWLKIRTKTHWRDKSHFLKTCAVAARHVIIDIAKKHSSIKRGGGKQHTPLTDLENVLIDFNETPEDIVLLGDLSDRMHAEAPDLANVFNLKYFGGYTEEEVAKMLDVTERTVRRKWKFARAWLINEMST